MPSLLDTILDIFEVKNVEKIDREELIENLSYAGDVIQEYLEESIQKDKSLKLSDDILYYVNGNVWEENNKLYLELDLSREDTSTEDEDEASKTVFASETPIEICKISSDMKNAEIIQKVQEKINEFQEKFLKLVKATK